MAEFLRFQENLRREASVMRVMKDLEISERKEKEREAAEAKKVVKSEHVTWCEQEWSEVDGKVEEMMHHIRIGRCDLVEQDLRSGILPWARDKDGISAVMIAVERRQPEIFRLLMSWGADEYKVDNWGRTLRDYLYKHHLFLFEFSDIIFKDNPRLIAFLMGKNDRLAKGTPIWNFLHDPLFDPNLVTLLGCFIKPIDFLLSPEPCA